ncbi:hypothetical protein [uncultured Sphingomonas sp.]|uniref:hypothetical protein n=1 Tax=uncultured Sphingomonas sp. TaxID=158754 RepID=UPI0025D84D34|nr:hypothetical protein [uncultured Sphingomonas sp.]
MHALALIALVTLQADDTLAWPMAEGFTTAFHEESPNGSAIEERVAKGETVEAWTRMITRITFPAPVDPMLFSTRMAERWQQACPGAVASPASRGPRGVDVRIDCPRNPTTGQAETMFQRVVPASGKLYILQVAFRSVPTDVQASWAKAELDRATLCRAGAVETACR